MTTAYFYPRASISQASVETLTGRVSATFDPPVPMLCGESLRIAHDGTQIHLSIRPRPVPARESAENRRAGERQRRSARR